MVKTGKQLWRMSHPDLALSVPFVITRYEWSTIIVIQETFRRVRATYLVCSHRKCLLSTLLPHHVNILIDLVTLFVLAQETTGKGNQILSSSQNKTHNKKYTIWKCSCWSFILFIQISIPSIIPLTVQHAVLHYCCYSSAVEILWK